MVEITEARAKAFGVDTAKYRAATYFIRMANSATLKWVITVEHSRGKGRFLIN